MIIIALFELIYERTKICIKITYIATYLKLLLLNHVYFRIFFIIKETIFYYSLGSIIGKIVRRNLINQFLWYYVELIFLPVWERSDNVITPNGGQSLKFSRRVPGPSHEVSGQGVVTRE